MPTNVNNKKQQFHARLINVILHRIQKKSGPEKAPHTLPFPENVPFPVRSYDFGCGILYKAPVYAAGVTAVLYGGAKKMLPLTGNLWYSNREVYRPPVRRSV